MSFTVYPDIATAELLNKPARAPIALAANEAHYPPVGGSMA
jgi:hypothetical protein